MSATINGIIRPVGILDGTRSDEIKAQLETILQGTSPVVVIDLEETTFVDSSGLGTLVSALKIARSAGRRLFLCSPNAQIQMVFELSGMDQAFEVFSSYGAFEAAMLAPSI